MQSEQLESAETPPDCGASYAERERARLQKVNEARRAASEAAGRKRGRPRLGSPTPEEQLQQQREIAQERARLARKMNKAALKRDQAFAEDGAQQARRSLEEKLRFLRRFLEERSGEERAAAEYRQLRFTSKRVPVSQPGLLS